MRVDKILKKIIVPVARMISTSWGVCVHSLKLFCELSFLFNQMYLMSDFFSMIGKLISELEYLKSTLSNYR